MWAPVDQDDNPAVITRWLVSQLRDKSKEESRKTMIGLLALSFWPLSLCLIFIVALLSIPGLQLYAIYHIPRRLYRDWRKSREPRVKIERIS